MTIDFFVTSGTLSADAPSYVTRPADDELLTAVRQGRFCYVLTSRQMGKSSLMNRTAARLSQFEICPVMIDLSSGAVSDATLEAWYFRLLKELKRQLKLRVNLSAWWQENNNLDPVSRFRDFLGEVVLAEVRAPIVIFVDEIDSTLSLPFSRDDFFATIRALYNQRATDPQYQRLTFVLLGVASLNELIADERRTPFNIGEGITLREFALDAPNPLQAMLQAAYPEQELYARVYHWTAGHPYLTQKICQAVMETGQAVDMVVERLFFDPEMMKKENHLQYIQGNVNGHAQKRPLLQLYQRVYRGRQVKNNDRDPLQNQLKLLGLVKATPTGLRVRNRIYERVFNEAWIKLNMPPDPNRYGKWGVSAVVVTVILATLFWFYNSRLTEEEQAQAYITQYEAETNPALRLDALVNLMTLADGKYQREATNRFYSQDRLTQTQLLKESNLPDRAQKLVAVVYPELRYQLWLTESNTILLEAMQPYLTATTEVDDWLKGRKHLQDEEYGLAVSAYNLAIGVSPDNALLRIERGLSYASLGQYQAAQADFEFVQTHHLTMTGLIPYLLRQNPAWVANPPPALRAFILTPTLTSTQTLSSKFVLIPAGPFIMGSSEYSWEQPVHTVYLPDYTIGQYETTNAQYAACVGAGQCTPPGSNASFSRESYYDNPDFADYPVVNVNWSQAQSYCEFVGGRLPTEAEWEKAARGSDGRVYPWGNEFDGTKANFCDQNCSLDWADKTVNDGYADTAPVGSYPQGVSPYGVHDLAGNVWEWTGSGYRAYPYRADDGREVVDITKNIVTLHGGAWDFGAADLRCAYRSNFIPSGHFSYVGVRCFVIPILK